MNEQISASAKIFNDIQKAPNTN